MLPGDKSSSLHLFKKMESTTSHANVSYYPHIAEIEDSFSSGHLNLASFIDELRDTIVENYDRDVFPDYKRAWIASVVEYSKIKVIDLVILNNVVMKCIY